LNAEIPQHFDLGRVAHPFRHDRQIEIAREVDQRSHKELVIGIDRKINDERPVDFHQIDIERLQVPEGGISGAEIVDGDLTAELPERLHKFGKLGCLMNGNRFGNFDNELFCQPAVRREMRGEGFAPEAVGGRAARNIQR